MPLKRDNNVQSEEIEWLVDAKKIMQNRISSYEKDHKDVVLHVLVWWKKNSFPNWKTLLY